MKNNQRQILEGSRAIALTVLAISPDVVSAYPITPQTHIVEDLAKFKADGLADYEYLRAESEFAAASIVLGASAAGSRVYSATSSQGLLLMTEVLFNIAGLRLPVVMTCANRSVSGPINIWNDHQDVMAVRDSGWIQLFAENNQEAVDQHILAYKISEATSLPTMVNMDGFILTHLYEPVILPDKKLVQKYLGKYRPKLGGYLDPRQPITMGSFVSPADYQEIRQELHQDLRQSLKLINQEYFNYQKILGRTTRNKDNNNGLVEYTGPKNAQTVIVAMGSMAGTIKEALTKEKNIGLLKIKCYRPFPDEMIRKFLAPTKRIIVLEKALSLGNSLGPLALDIKGALKGEKIISDYTLGLGGRDITTEIIKKIIDQSKKMKKTTRKLNLSINKNIKIWRKL